jgi:hypothetical protein
MMRGRTPKQAAQRFIVWREGESVGWNCTYADLIAATGLSEHVVRWACRSMKKRPHNEDDLNAARVAHGESMSYGISVDKIMAYPYLQSAIHFKREMHGEE